jgi:hypothetical protein
MGAAAASGRSLAWSVLRRSAAPARQDSATGPRSACLAAPFPGLVLAARDEPVNLSDSRLRTHQDWLPADANRCQSLLLDPDATIDIDLHRRLFLLVSGRGE